VRTTLDGRVVDANASALELFGAATLHDLSERESLFSDGANRERLLADLRNDGRVSGFRVELVREDGSPFSADLHAALVPGPDGQPLYIDGILEDLGRLVQAEEERRRLLLSFETLVNNTPAVAIQIYDREGRVQLWNPASETLYGYSAHEMLGKRIQDTLLPAEDVPAFEAEVEHMCTSGLAAPPREWTVVNRDGSRRYVYSTMFPLPQMRKGVAFCCMDVDITERKRAEEILAESEERYRLMAENSTDMISRHTPEGVYLYASPACRTLLGYEPQELAGRQALSLFHPADVERIRGGLPRVFGNDLTSTYRIQRKDGSYAWFETTSRTVLSPSTGEVQEIIAVSRDITERKHAEEQVAYQAYHDALTGLPNRMLFNDRLTLAIANAHRGRHPLAVAFLDLDHFKRINDTLGHSLGDRLLQSVAARVTGCLREGDTVARLGGDEFTLILHDISQGDDAAKIAQKILEAIAAPFEVDGHRLYVTTSVGISLYPEDGTDAETLLKNADTAMYRAKESGRNNYQLCAPAMTSRALERLSLENSLRRALERHEFTVFYQPVREVRGHRFTAVEALVRWRHPERGLIGPGEFIPVAEESRLILPLGEWVLREACRQAQDWHTSGLPGLRVAVNLSARQFQQQGLVETVERVLAETSFPASCLELEITESIAMNNLEVTHVILRSLRELGVKISIDDFGTGHSSLGYLKRFPIDALKIDQTFVQDVTTDPHDAAIVAAVISLGHSLGLRVVAEGVETVEQLSYLQNEGCDEMQGFLLSQPLEPNEIRTRLFGKV
jgi:diguanylate cyclase (GGDEF)-like protein/PAS domain S-box-containing protein